MFNLYEINMISNNELIDVFNNKLVEFAKDLCYIFPSVNDFHIFLTACEWSICIDKKSPQSFFHSLVVHPFKDKILKKDESFFLCESYEEYSDYMKHYGHDLNLVQKLKKIWQTLDEGNKNIIWKYMQVLMCLSLKCKATHLHELNSKIFVAQKAKSST